MIYPIVELTRGATPSNSAFCQISGFFLAVGIEACDIAVVLLALHTALYIIYSGTSNGLQPYRRVAYCLFVGLPFLLASLAFINEPGYANSGEYCYLPLHPDWARRSLSWIPRYIIFITILALYVFIYIHVAVLMNRYSAHLERRPRRGECPISHQRRRGAIPPLPRISTHGLVPSIISSRRASAESKARRESLFSSFSNMLVLGGGGGSGGSRRASGASAALIPGPKRSVQVVRWQLPRFGGDSAHLPHLEEPGLVLEARHTTALDRDDLDEPPMSPTDIAVPIRPLSRQYHAAATAEQQEGTAPSLTATTLGFWNRSVAFAAGTIRGSRSPSISNAFTILRRGPRSSSSRTTSSIFLSPTLFGGGAGMRAMRENVLRQTRYLFVYPLVYLCVWLAPFISHVMHGDSMEAPFGLMLTSLFSLAIQGFADALVFSLREKPWKSWPVDGENDPPFWTRGQDWQHNSLAGSVGRSRDSINADQRIARWRLDEELTERQMEREGGQRVVLDWWEVEHRRILMSVESTSVNNDDLTTEHDHEHSIWAERRVSGGRSSELV